MPTLRSVVQSNIRAEMARREMPQREVAAAVGVSQQSLSLKLSGRRPMTVEELVLISEALELDIAELLPPRASSGAGSTCSTRARSWPGLPPPRGRR